MVLELRVFRKTRRANFQIEFKDRDKLSLNCPRVMSFLVTGDWSYLEIVLWSWASTALSTPTKEAKGEKRQHGVGGLWDAGGIRSENGDFGAREWPVPNCEAIDAAAKAVGQGATLRTDGENPIEGFEVFPATGARHENTIDPDFTVSCCVTLKDEMLPLINDDCVTDGKTLRSGTAA